MVLNKEPPNICFLGTRVLVEVEQLNRTELMVWMGKSRKEGS